MNLITLIFEGWKEYTDRGYVLYPDSIKDAVEKLYKILPQGYIEDISCESEEEIEYLKEWIKNQNERGWTCFQLAYHGNMNSYEAIVALDKDIMDVIVELHSIFYNFSVNIIESEDVW